VVGRPTRKYASNLDPGGVLKNVHSQEADALRVIDTDNIVGSYWSHVVLAYDGNDSVESADFYYDEKRGIYNLTTLADVAGSLNNKTFLINSGQNEKQFYVWYNVGGTGVDPEIPGRTGIEVPVAFNDPAGITALASQLVLNNIPEFNVKMLLGNKIQIENEVIGQSSISDFDTGFNFDTIQDGISSLVKTYDFPQQNDIKYVYNPYEKTFEVIDTSPIEVTLESSSRTPTIVNLTVLLANTEQSIALPDNTKKFTIKVRENDTKLKIKYDAAGSFLELKRAIIYTEDNLLTTSVTIFFETNKPGKTVELVYWT